MEYEELRRQLAPFAFEAPNVSVYNFSVDPMASAKGCKILGNMPHKKSIDVPNSALGIGFETLDRDTFDPVQTFPFLAESGIKYARCQTGWMKCEKVLGTFDFGWLDTVVDGLSAIGIETWFSLSFGHPKYTPCRKYEEENARAKAEGKLTPGWARGWVGETPYLHGEEAMTAWKRYVAAICEHFKGRVKMYEVWNEPEWFWVYEGERQDKPLSVKAREYTDFVRITAEVVRSVIPDAEIIAVVANTGSLYIRELGKAGVADYIDTFSYHFYGCVPEDFMAERVNHIRANIRRSDGRPVKLIQGESGRASGKSALFSFATEYGQARYLTRRFLIDFKCGAAMSSLFTVSNFLCYYPDGSDQYYGLLDSRANRAKLGYYALQSMGWLFDGLELAPDLFMTFSPYQRHNYMGTALPYRVETISMRRKSIPVFAAWIPEHVDINATPLTGVFSVLTDEKTQLPHPVAIDPIRRTVWDISELKACGWNGSELLGGESFYPFTLTDYPLFVTDASVFDELPCEKLNKPKIIY